jgi:hypothetical protein
LQTIINLHFGRKPGTARLSNRINTVLKTIEECIKERRLYPALILIYSSIDILGALNNPDGFATRDSFKNWITNYLFQEKTFPFDESDLWGARCGIVHTMRYDSQLASSVKTIVYGFYGHDDEIKGIINPAHQSGVYIEDLFEAFTNAYKKYIEDLENSVSLIINTNLDLLPAYVDLLTIN